MPSLLDSKMTVHEPTALDMDHRLPQQATVQAPKPPGTSKLLDMSSPLGAEMPTAPPANPQPKGPPVMREFGDSDALRSSIYKNVFDAAARMPAVSNTRYSLRLVDPHYADDEKRSIAERKKAILTGQSLHRRLRGTWELVDNEGKVVDKKTTTVANIPHLTNQGTFVLGGTEYTLAHQMRLRPGIFTRIKENGEIESHINIMPGKGLSHRYFLEPSTGVFKISIGQANLPLYPVMKAMGINDEQLRESWGPELLAANMGKDDTRTIDKLYTRLIGKRADVNATAEQKRDAVVKSLTSMEVDPEVTKRTLGIPFTHMDSAASLATTKKLLAVSRGEADTDDRDHLAFQNFLGPEDLFAERLGRDKMTLNELLWRATTRGNLERLPAGAFTKHVHDAIMESGLGQSLEEINPADVFDQQTRVSRLGYGGIPSIDAVPDEARNVQPSHLGYIDLLRTPESADADTEVLTSCGWKKWPDVTKSDELSCLIDGRLEFHKPLDLFAVDYDGPMYCGHTEFLDFCVTPNHRHYVQKAGRRSDYVFETADKTFDKSCRWFKTGHLPYAGNVAVASCPISCSALDWAEFMGWYLSEGCVRVVNNKAYQANISQSTTANPDNCDRLAKLFVRLGVDWTQLKDGTGFNINNQKLAAYCQQFGLCDKKFIPEDLLHTPVEIRLMLFEALLLGDGRKSRRGVLTQFCTTSQRLALDFERLAISLGKPCRVVFEKDDRQPQYLGCYVVHLHERSARQITRYSSRTGQPYHSVKNYSGKVYCPRLPGGMFYARRNGSVGYWTGNSFKVGIDSRMSYTAKKGDDNRVYTPFIDPKTGEQTFKSPQDVADLVVAFPGEMQGGKAMVAALVNGKTTYVPRDKVQLVMPHMEQAFSPINNLVPLKSTVKGQRAAMASRFITQALPLRDAEAPHVRGALPGTGISFDEFYGKHMGAVHAKDQPGRVTKVEDDGISVQYQDGTTEKHELYHNFPYNRKTYLHNTPQVEPGDMVQPQQLLASSNYTDKTGAVALGKNMRVAYIPFRGTNYEDAYVISEGAAKKFSSEHMYQHSVEWDELHRRGKRSYVSIFPGTFPKKNLDTMDEEGIIKPGTLVQPGDPLILAARQREITRKQVHSAHKGSFADNSVTWDHHNEGVVTDVEKTDKGVVVAVKSLNLAQVGDKISGRYGDKGVIGSIIPDDQMPHDKEGQPYEVLANPLGIISRTNAGQMIEAALGKISAKTGKHYAIDDFNHEVSDLTEYAQKELDKHGLEGAETITDPITGRQIPGVMTGNRYFMKLHHTSESKGQGRGLGTYTAEGMPAKGGAEGSKRLALMDVNALLSHGAIETLRDAKLIRGQKNQEYWSAFMSGFKPPTPQVPLVYQKFINQLKASGINVVREGQQLHIMAMTNKDIDHLSGDRELENPETVDWKTEMKPIKGGLFDERLTGGHNGNRWSKITLHEPMPNPVFEEPIRRVLGLTQKKFEAVLSGREKLGEESGPEAIRKALGQIHLDQAIGQARADIKSGRKTLRDAAVRKLGYLKSAEEQGIHPKEWMVDKVPIIPPMFRPVSVMQGTGGRLVADANYLYKEVFDANNNFKALKSVAADVGDERLALYNSFKAVTGLGDPVQPKNQERKVKGMLAQIFGPSPKYSVVQQKLLGTTVDLVGRAVVVPNPDLNMDEVGLPEARAWEVYTPFIVRRLVRRGVPRLTALEYVRDRHNLARSALQEEVQERPVIVTRAPVLHRYGLMAFFPKLTKGDTLQIPPIVVGGFGMDFDGDASNYHVPASDEAKEEALNKLLPSKNLLSVAQFKPHYMPRQEYVSGLFSATQQVNRLKKPRFFATKQDAIRAYNNGQLDPNQPIQIVDDSSMRRK